MAENRIIIFGDSWGIGEWSFGGKCTHPGLNLYLKELGYQIINFSSSGRSNQGIHYDIECNLDKLNNDDIILCIETDPIRDSCYENLEQHISEHSGLINYLQFLRSEHYKRINSLNIKLNLIGGLSNIDVTQTHHNVPVPSWINLMLDSEDCSGNDFFALDLPFLVRAIDKSKFDNHTFEIYINDLQILKLRDRVFDTEWFKRDKYHPGREGHKLLVDELVKKLKL